MIRKNIISNGEPTAAQLKGFKAYAHIDGTSDDEVLSELLTSAMLAVQEFADTTLLACDIRVVDDSADGMVRLYEDVDEVLSVKADGMASGYSLQGRHLYAQGRVVEVTYRTRANAGSAARLMPVVYRYAAALEAGDDQTVLNGILKSVSSIC